MAFIERYGPWALVTGTSSGIGAEFARQLAAKKLHIAMVARRKDRLVALAQELTRDHGVETLVIEADLSDSGAVELVVAALADRDVGLVVNNAGRGEKGEFLSRTSDDYQKMIALNCATPVALTHALGEKLLARKRGGVIFTASSAAFQGMPLTAVYAASKSFDLLFGEALHDEWKGYGIDVLTLCPGSTDTEGPRRTGVDPKKVAMMSVVPVVQSALTGLGNQAVVVPGWRNKLLAFLTRFLPRRLNTYLAGRIVRSVTGT